MKANICTQSELYEIGDSRHNCGGICLRCLIIYYLEV